MRKRTGLGWAASLLALAVGVEAAAQDETREQAPTPDVPAIVEAERARAHERMPSTMYASTPSADKPYFAHPSTSATPGAERAEPSDWHRATAKVWGPTSADGSDTAEDVFRKSISEPVVQSKCINCHVSGGASGATRLVFAPATTDDHVSFNYRVFEDFLVSAPNGAALILDKIKGVAHGGGNQVPAGSGLYADMESFLDLLDGGAAAPVTVETLFDTVRMRSNRETLYRAAIILAGRIPTTAEYAALESAGLRATVRGLMIGLGFHDFLIRAANDRLLTDAADAVAIQRQLVNGYNEYYRLYRAAKEGSGSWRTVNHYYSGLGYGAMRAPLELIAHVVRNDLPYTDVLTADYVMANPQTAIAFGASPAFDDPHDVHEFKPARIEAHYARDGLECDAGVCSVVDPESRVANYPHAGVLNTWALLYRYPTTPTNRNRARARWTYHHFLGIDVEQLGTRALSPSALVDEENPTMNNAACTGCHALLDPVAGAFQNYDEYGTYRGNWDGLDSLPGSYKHVRFPSLGQEELAASQSVVTFHGQIENQGRNPAIRFGHSDGTSDAWLYLDKLTVTDENARAVYVAEVERGVLQYTEGDGCRIANDHIALRKDCKAIVGLPVAEAIDGVRLAEGDYRFELAGWASRGASVEATLDWFTPYRRGDTWFRDMRPPGFNGEVAPDSSNSLQWLGRGIAEDERFAQATVKFWWPAVMGKDVATPPATLHDADFAGKSLAAEAQTAEVERLSTAFRAGIRDGQPYNLKDLLVELVLSKWFRAGSIRDSDPVRLTALRDAGGSRPLTPEELVNKTEALTGFAWGRRRDTFGPEFGRPRGALASRLSVVYGGIDSKDVTKRSRFTTPMAQLAKKHATIVSVAAVAREFFALPKDQRRLFAGIELSATPETAPDAIKSKLADMHEKLFGVRAGSSSADIRGAYQFVVDVWRLMNSRAVATEPRSFWRSSYWWTDHRYFDGILEDALVDLDNSGFHWSDNIGADFANKSIPNSTTDDEMRMAQIWDIVLATMLADYRYLHL